MSDLNCSRFQPPFNMENIWVVVLNIFIFTPIWGKIPILTCIFFKGVGKNQQLDIL